MNEEQENGICEATDTLIKKLREESNTKGRCMMEMSDLVQKWKSQEADFFDGYLGALEALLFSIMCESPNKETAKKSIASCTERAETMEEAFTKAMRAAGMAKEEKANS